MPSCAGLLHLRPGFGVVNLFVDSGSIISRRKRMRLDSIDVGTERRSGNGVPATPEEAWQLILAQSLTEVAERRERERRAQAQHEREQRMRYAFD